MGKKSLFPSPKTGPKVLVYDIETAPIVAHVWSLWKNDVGLNQIQSDWHLLSWAAKWLDDPPSKIMYQDQRGRRNIQDDKHLLKGIWKLLDECDIVVTQNGKGFDQKKLNARFIMSGFKPPSPYKHIDTCEIAKRHFGFTSNKLQYLTGKLCKKYQKLTDKRKFPGHALWVECMKGNLSAWREMEKYNKYDVLSLEELYQIMSPWGNNINFNLYHDDCETICNCGSTNFKKNGNAYTSNGKYQRFKCHDCGTFFKAKENQFSKEKRKSLKTKVVV